MKTIELHLPIKNENTQIISTIKSQCDLSSADIKQAISKGALWLTRGKYTQRLRRVKKPLKPSDSLHFYYNENVLNQTCEDAALLLDRKDYSIWYKPYGMLSQGSKWSDHLTISRFAQQNLPDERAVFIVHRLDRAASGIIVVAHSKSAARALTQLFEQHQLEKRYQIIVHGNHQLRPQPEIITDEIDGKRAKSTFNFLEYNEAQDCSLIDVLIETGRKHQIRRHAASIGFPVIGDRLHGDESISYASNINLQLCSVKLAFTCPISNEAIVVELPQDKRPNLAQLTWR